MKKSSLLQFAVISALILVLSLISLSYANAQSISNIKDIYEYIDKFKEKKVESIHEVIKSDISFLNKEIDFRIRNTYFLPGSSTSINFNELDSTNISEDGFIPAKPFRIGDNSKEKEKFFKLSENTLFTQYYEYPNSKVGLNLTNYSRSYKLRLLKFYSKGNEIDVNSNFGFKTIDSVRMSATFNINNSYETFFIPTYKSGSIKYREYNIEIDSLGLNSMLLYVPLELGEKILAVQGISQEDKLVNSNYAEKNNVYSVKKDKIQCLHSIKDVLESCLLLDNKKKIIKSLKSITQKEIDVMNDISSFIPEARVRVSEYNKMMIYATFDYNLKGVNLCVADDITPISYEYTILPKKINNSKYVAFVRDKDKYKYGIADTDGNIIVPAVYNYIELKGGNFFGVAEGARWSPYNLSIYALDTDKKVLRPLPNDFKYCYGGIMGNDNIAICSDKFRMLGVISDKFEILLPFKYNIFEYYDDYLFASVHFNYYNDDEDRYEIFDNNLNRVPIRVSSIRNLPDIFFSHLGNNGGNYDKKEFLICTTNNKYGILSTKKPLHWKIPPIYDYISGEVPRLFIVCKNDYGQCNYGIVDIDNKFILPLKYSDIRSVGYDRPNLILVSEIKNGTELTGVMDLSGKIVIPLEYKGLDYLREGFYRYKANDKYGLISENGDVIAEPIYSYIGTFNAGYAFVRNCEYFAIINSKGEIVMKQQITVKMKNYL